MLQSALRGTPWRSDHSLGKLVQPVTQRPPFVNQLSRPKCNYTEGHYGNGQGAGEKKFLAA
jgi:hypothetical protein